MGVSSVKKSNGKQIDLITNDALDAAKRIKALHTPELVIALCGPIGSPLNDVADCLVDLLENSFNYAKVSKIRLSQFIDTWGSSRDEVVCTSKGTPEYTRLERMICLGNEMRRQHGKEVLAKLAIKKILQTRLDSSNAAQLIDAEEHSPNTLTDAVKPIRVAHVIDSIKNQSELEVLRLVYGDLLYSIGVYSPITMRESRLKRLMDDVEVSKLVDRDSGEEINNGQTVRDTFPSCDYFLRVDDRSESEMASSVRRFLRLILGQGVVTPTRHEMAMYAAASAAGHSACLSRQVGACMTSESGEILATGWNDVPKFGGGLYSSDLDGIPDLRCWNRDGGKCFNDDEKELLASEIADFLVSSNLVDEGRKSELAEKLRQQSKLKDLIEFSRAIHAEMHAILRALSLGGERVKNGSLYVTTYPCHSCARHIVAAGIREVFFIEPYRKSRATRLHDDAISENEDGQGRVVLKQYDGVAPRRFLALFKSGNARKISGRAVKILPRDAMPITRLSLDAVPRLESMVVAELKDWPI